MGYCYFQADINAAIGGMSSRDGQDFSKIQGRFSTRLQLSSSNTSEVIQKRLLVKTDAAKPALAKVWQEKGDILRNQLALIQQPPLLCAPTLAKKNLLITTRLSRGTTRFCRRFLSLSGPKVPPVNS